MQSLLNKFKIMLTDTESEMRDRGQINNRSMLVPGLLPCSILGIALHAVPIIITILGFGPEWVH